MSPLRKPPHVHIATHARVANMYTCQNVPAQLRLQMCSTIFFVCQPSITVGDQSAIPVLPEHHPWLFQCRHLQHAPNVHMAGESYLVDGIKLQMCYGVPQTNLTCCICKRCVRVRAGSECHGAHFRCSAMEFHTQKPVTRVEY